MNYLGRVLKGDEKIHYFYANTRVRAKASKLMKETEYEKMMKMDINEVLRFLQEGEYKKEIDIVGIRAARIEQLEKVLNDNFANAVSSVLRFTPRNSPLWQYVMRYDIQNIKMILRGKAAKGRKEDIWQKLIPLGMFGKDFLKMLVDAETREQAIEHLKRTPYYKILGVMDKKSQEELEDALDKFYFKIMLNATTGNKKLLKFIKTEIDARNILTLLRLKRTKARNTEWFLISGGNITVKRLIEISRLGEFEIINAFKGSKLWKYAPTNTKEIDKIEAGLRRYVLMYGGNLKKDYSPTTNALFGYVFGKEREIANIRILARAKTTKNPEDALNIRSRLYVR